MTAPPGMVRRYGSFVALGGIATILTWLAGSRVSGLLLSTAQIAVPAAGVSLAIGTLLALVITKTEVAGRGLALALIGALTLAPATLVATGWMSALGDGGWAPALFAGEGPIRGWLGGQAGAIFLHGFAGAPLTTLLAVAALRSVDPQKEQEALLDAPGWRVLTRVTLPQAAPPLAAAALLVAVLAAGDMTITDLFRLRTFAEEVYTQTAAGQLATAVGGGGAIALGVAAITAVAVATLRGLARLSLTRPTGQTGRHGLTLGRPAWASVALGLLVGLLVLVPVGSMAHNAGLETRPSPDGATRVLNPVKLVSSIAAAPWQHRRELRVSLTLAGVVATTATLAGGTLAWIGRRGGVAAATIAVAAATLLATPGPVIGLAVIRLLNQPLDSTVWFLGDLYGTWFAPWLAQQARITPVVALALWPAMAAVPQGLLEAARVDGASAVARALRVAAPLVAGPLAAGWLVAFALSLGELSATVLVVPPGTPPLSVRMLSLLHYGVEDRVAALGLVLLAGYTIAAALVFGLMPKRPTSGKISGPPE